MKRGSILILSLILLAGCVYMQPDHKSEPLDFQYYRQIKNWQERINTEGWSESRVDEIVSYCRRISLYTPEPPGEDCWQLPGEMIGSGFKGDCEDIAILMTGTLYSLGYPKDRVRLVIVRMPFLQAAGFPLSLFMDTDHCIIRVQLPGGRWKPYDSVDPFLNLGMWHYLPAVEFSANQIWTWKQGGAP